MASTRFGKISPLWQKIKTYGNILNVNLFGIWQSTEYNLAQFSCIWGHFECCKCCKRYKNNLVIWSHWDPPSADPIRSICQVNFFLFSVLAEIHFFVFARHANLSIPKHMFIEIFKQKIWVEFRTVRIFNWSTIGK